MVSHPELGSDPPIGPDRDSGCDRFHSKEVIDYIETFSPISTKNSFWVIMTLVAH